MRRGQHNRWVYEAFPGECVSKCGRTATYTIHREGRAYRLCAPCLLHFKRKEREAV